MLEQGRWHGHPPGLALRLDLLVGGQFQRRQLAGLVQQLEAVPGRRQAARAAEDLRGLGIVTRDFAGEAMAPYAVYLVG